MKVVFYVQEVRYVAGAGSTGAYMYRKYGMSRVQEAQERTCTGNTLCRGCRKHRSVYVQEIRYITDLGNNEA